MTKLSRKKIIIIASLIAIAVIVVVPIILITTKEDEKSKYYDISDTKALSGLSRTTAVYYIETDSIPKELSDFLKEIELYDNITVTFINPVTSPTLLEALNENENSEDISSGDMVIKYASKHTEIITANELVSDESFIGEGAVLDAIRSLSKL